MWKYLVINSLWFAILFLVHFVGTKSSQRFVIFCFLLSAIASLFLSTIDPSAWVFYFIYSIVVCISAQQFGRWIFARSAVLDEEIEVFTNHLNFKKEVLREKENNVQIFQKKANEITSLYEKAREMSQSLYFLETLIVLGEALAKNFNYQSIKLAIFEDGSQDYQAPIKFYEIEKTSFDQPFDRASFLKDAQNLKVEFFPTDKKYLEQLFKDKQSIFPEEDSGYGVVAIPIFLDQKIFSALLVTGVSASDAKQVFFTILIQSFILDIQRLKLYEQVERLAITDGLTGVYVRRHLVERLEGEIDRCKRFGLKLAFLMIDVDHFKRFNDDYGHLVGDVVLKQVAALIKKNTREVDLVGRYGGEEFGVLLVETDEQAALIVAERIRRSISEHSFRAYDENLIVTVSIGCSIYSRALGEPSLIVEAADSALYQAKRQGRDRVCLYNFSDMSKPQRDFLSH